MSLTCPSCEAVYPDDARFCGRCATPLQSDHSKTGRLPPQAILQGRYLILKRIARGGMGAVYLAADQRMAGKEWAIKEMSSLALGPTQELAAREAFHQEAKMLARLNHAHLPTVADFFRESGKYYLVMEYVRGQTMQSILAELGRIPEATVLPWARQLCAVLGFLHSQQPPIIFRDLKPANIMITQQGQVKLIDFGIARHFQPDKEGDTRALGTPGYAAPEQYGRDQSDARTDIYGLGVTLYHLLSGRDPSLHPFHFPPLRQLAPAVSVQTALTIEQAVQRDPNARFQTMEAMQAALSRTPIDVDVQPEPEKKSPIWTRFLSGNRVKAALGFVAVLLILAFVIRFALPAAGKTETPTPEAPVTVALTDPSQTVVVDQLAPEPTPAIEPSPTPQINDTATSEPVIPTDEPATATLSPPTATVLPATTTSAPPTVSDGAELVGASHEGRPIEVYRYGNGPNAVVLVGGLHSGFAPSSVSIASQFVAHYRVNGDEIPETISLYIIPNMNPDSAVDPGFRPGRTNARGVDLNRNWDCDWRPQAEWDGQPINGGATPFSEPETRAVRDFLLDLQPAAVIFYEARAADGLVTPGNCNGAYSGSDTLMHTYQRASNYRWLDGDAVTGDASNWAAREGMASIFVILRSWTELPDAEWQRNLRGIQAVFNQYQ